MIVKQCDLCLSTLYRTVMTCGSACLSGVAHVVADGDSAALCRCVADAVGGGACQVNSPRHRERRTAQLGGGSRAPS